MHIIARPAIEDAKLRHPQSRVWLDNWWRTAARATWRSLHDVRHDYPSADQVGDCLVFDAPGARRLICNVHYATDERHGTLYVRSFLTHAEYDRGDWRDVCW
jgi:mRNA interferase HigB